MADGEHLDAISFVAEMAWNLREWLRECGECPSLRPVLESLVPRIRATLEMKLVDSHLAQMVSTLPQDEDLSGASLIAFAAKLHLSPPPGEPPIRWMTLSRHRARIVAARLVDEHGEPMFDLDNAQDLEAIEAWPAADLAMIYEAGAALDKGESPAKSDAEQPAPAAASSDVAWSPGFRWVRWFGEDYSFTANQAPVVELLYENWKAGTPDVGDETLLLAVDAEAPPARLDTLFRGRAAWGTMILPGATKGTHKLARSPKENM